MTELQLPITNCVLHCSTVTSGGWKWRHHDHVPVPLAVLTMLTSACGLVPLVLVFLRNAAVGALPPRGARAAIVLLLPPAAAAAAAERAVQLADRLQVWLGLTRWLGGHPLGGFWVEPWWGQNWARTVGLGSRVMALKEHLSAHMYFSV